MSTAANKTVLMVPRYSGDHTSDYLPWLAEQLATHGIALRVAPLLPAPDRPAIDPSVASIDAALEGVAPDDVVLMTHSVGAQIALRWLAARGATEQVRAFVVVAGWWTIDEPWPRLMPFIERPFDLDNARRAARETHVYLGADDPFTSDQQQNAALWRERMGAVVEVLEGRGHYNVDENDDVLGLLLDLCALPPMAG